MTDEKIAEGELVLVEKKPGKNYYHVQLKDATIDGTEMMSRFDGNYHDLEAGKELLNKYVDEGTFHARVKFTENISKGKTFRNIAEVEEIKEEEVKPQATAAPDYNFGAFFGMISNQTFEHLNKATIPKGIRSKDYEVLWNEVFDRLWDLNTKKRDEKSGRQDKADT